MNSLKVRHAPPKAGAMVEALRGLGYNTATALADIIDNSIAAGADRVELDFIWDGDASRIEIRDNGRGMSLDDLDKAMRLGELNPLNSRAANDLGRFGMGLKTASFSQCRSLTVASWKDNEDSCLRWDLDVLASETGGGWYLLEGAGEGSEPYITSMDKSQQQGTLVLWEKLDRIVTDGYTEQNFLDLIDQVEQHLAMVFHRFINGDAAPVYLLLNGKKIKPWDPFLMGHPAKAWSSPELSFSTSAGSIKAACHVLPQKDRLSDDGFLRLGGPDGWTSQQGFYVYRNKRLLVAGSWLGLGKRRAWTKDEAHQLARISVDIPNTADTDWEIDIRKSTARPPVEIRKWLQRLAEDTQARARKAFTKKSKATRVPRKKETTAVWVPEHIGNATRYRINRDHPLVDTVMQRADSDADLFKLFGLLEETLPVQRLWTSVDDSSDNSSWDTGSSVVDNTEDGEPPEAMRPALQLMFKNLVTLKGYGREAAIRSLQSTEPFNKYPDFVSATFKNL